MVNQYVVGPQYGANGTQTNQRSDKTGAGAVVDAHGRYFEPTSRSAVFSAANQAAVVSPAGLTASSLNFTLYNPANSGVLLSIIEILAQIAAAPAAASVIWLVQNNNPLQAAPATTTALVVGNNNLSIASGAGKAYSTATLAAAPTVLRPIASVPAAANNSAMMIKDEVAGLVVVPPGCYVSIQALTAISLMCSMTWEEIPII